MIPDRRSLTIASLWRSHSLGGMCLVLASCLELVKCIPGIVYEGANVQASVEVFGRRKYYDENDRTVSKTWKKDQCILDGRIDLFEGLRLHLGTLGHLKGRAVPYDEKAEIWSLSSRFRKEHKAEA
jgi:hypothetical protein